MNDELLLLADEWTFDELNQYIHKLEMRVELTKELIRDLKVIRRRKSRRKIVDTGTRGGQ